MTTPEDTRIHTGRREIAGIRTADNGDIEEIRRVVYYRATKKTGFCPFCESSEGVEWDGKNDDWQKRRSVCECGASGNHLWTWPAGTVEVAQ